MILRKVVEYMRKMRLFMMSMIIICMTTSVFASELELSGELKQGIKYNFEDSEITSTNIDYCLELEKELGFDGDLYLSFKGNYDLLNQTSKISLDEAYTSVYMDLVDLTIGRQVINWGTADGINPTNSINPKSLDSLVDGNGKPVLAAQATYYADLFSITGVLIPDFLPQELPDFSAMVSEIDDSAAIGFMHAISDFLQDQYDQLDENVPNTLDSMECALQGEFRVSGYDLKASYFYGWEDLPAIVLQPSLDPLSGQPIMIPQANFRRVNKLGLATAGSYETVGLWGEMALVMPEDIDLAVGSKILSMNEPYLQAVIGSDYTFSNGVYLEGQYLYYGNGSLFIPYNLDFTEEVKPGHYLMNHLSYEMDQNQKVELTSIIDIVNKGGTVMPAYIRSLTQSTELTVKPMVSFGEDSEFANLSTQLAIALKTSF